MEVTVHIDEQDLVALNEHINRTNPMMRRQFFAVWLLVPLLLVGLGMLVITDRDAKIHGYFFLVFAAVWLVGLPAFMKWIRYRTVRRLSRSGRNLGIYGEFRIALTPNEIARYG